MTQPRILLMDEAFSALDPGTRKEMQRLIPSTVAGYSNHNSVCHTQHAGSSGRGTRVIVLAKETAEHGSQAMLDLTVPAPCGDEDIPAACYETRAGIGRCLISLFQCFCPGGGAKRETQNTMYVFIDKNRAEPKPASFVSKCRIRTRTAGRTALPFAGLAF